ncbi:unnamed protein product, partial [Rotaria magnacalcarata]
VSKIPNVGSLSIDNTNESSVPLIVVNEIISSEETSANASEEAEHFMHRESPFEKHHDGKIKTIQTPV